MKKHLITLLVLLISFGAFAQKDKEKQKEKLKALKIAHITEQLDLTKKEAEAFWPIYNAHEDKLNALRNNSSDKRRDFDLDSASEDEAKKHVLDMLKIEKDKQDIENKFINDLLKILAPTKVIKLNRAERSFKRKMIEEFRGRHRGARKE